MLNSEAVVRSTARLKSSLIRSDCLCWLCVNPQTRDLGAPSCMTISCRG